MPTEEKEKEKEKEKEREMVWDSRDDLHFFSSGPFHIPPREKQSLVEVEMTALLLEPKHASKLMGVLTKRAPLTNYKHLKRVRKIESECVDLEQQEKEEEKGQQQQQIKKKTKKKKEVKLQVLICTRTPEEGGGWGRVRPRPTMGEGEESNHGGESSGAACPLSSPSSEGSRPNDWCRLMPEGLHPFLIDLGILCSSSSSVASSVGVGTERNTTTKTMTKMKTKTKTKMKKDTDTDTDTSCTGSGSGIVECVKVPKFSPEDKEQWEEWNQIWPITFQIPPGKVAKRSAEIALSQEEKKNMKEHMRKAANLARRNRESGQVCNAAVMVDPETNQVIAVGSDETLGWEHGNHRNPLRHAAMVACENVAKRILRLFPGAGTSRRANALDLSQSETSPVKKRLCQEDHRNVSKGDMDMDMDMDMDIREGEINTSGSNSQSTINKKEPYLCTGLDCYLWQEPCIMCAMALVHSRIRRIIYCMPDKEAGVLGGSYRLHSLSQLNHHYEVFHQPYDGGE